MSNRTSDAAPTSAGADERIKAIQSLVTTHGFQTIEALAERFGVSSQTIRRDVNALSDRGLCRRRHGGVDVLPEAERGPANMAYPARRILQQEAKQAIARCVAAAVPDGASLFFGIGTTPEQCAHALCDRQGLRVMTNNLNVALALCRNTSTELTIAGGRLRPVDRDVVAGEAHGFFSRYAADIGIFGVGAVAEDGSLLDFSLDEVRMRSELMRHCRQRFLVLDHSKFGRSAPVRGGHITEASIVFCDQAPPPAIAALLAQAQVSLVVAPDPTSFVPSSLTPGEA